VVRIETALISCSDKAGLPEFAARLVRMGVKLLSTGGTARLLRESGLQVEDVADYTGFPEILDGRVKTLHPKVHAGLLAHREEAAHVRQMEELGIRPIDMVVVNLYPFVDVISRPNVELTNAIDNIDIGGSTMIRAAAKNHSHVAVVTNPRLYDRIADEMEDNDGSLSGETRFSLAVEAFRHTAHYDTSIARYLAGIEAEHRAGPERITLEFVKKQRLEHGENPHQSAAFFVQEHLAEPCVGNMEHVSGPPLSYSSVLDANVGIELAKEFDRPVAVLTRVANPWGVGTGSSLVEAFERASRGAVPGPAAYTIVLNRPLDVCTAEAIVRTCARVGAGEGCCLVDSLVATGFDADALDLVRRQVASADRMRVLQARPLSLSDVDEAARDGHQVRGGMVAQSRDLLGFDAKSVEIVTSTAPTDGQMEDLRLAWLCCKYVRSSGAVLAKEQALVAVGSGQATCADSVRLALSGAGDSAGGCALAVDGPMSQVSTVELAAESGIAAVIHAGGDGTQAVADAADRLGIAVVVTRTSHLRH